jgi:acetolactate synthase-1/2/3 large subunit
MTSGGRLLVDQLLAEGVRTVFTVPGESFLPVLDALYDHPQVQTVTCRHEGGAAMMAEATGRLTGRPGVAIVSRGPGALNAASGVHVARQSSTPMLLLVGLGRRDAAGREGFQEIDPQALFASEAKWVATVPQAGRIAEYVSRAMRVATAGRPGPVVLGLPEDVLEEATDATPWPAVAVPEPVPAGWQMEALGELLRRAERPLVLVGRTGWTAVAAQRTEIFAARFDLPVLASYRAQDCVDNRLPCYAGHTGFVLDAKLATALRAADLVIAAGTRLDEITRGGGRALTVPSPAQKLVHVFPDAQTIAAGGTATLGIAAGAEAFATALADLEPPSPVPWTAWRRDLRAAYEMALAPPDQIAVLDVPAAIGVVSQMLPEDAIVANGAGDYAGLLHRHFVYKRPGTQAAPQSGSMGYGLPAAIAAKLAFPERTVVAFAGDGCFQMTGQELATAVQYGLALTIIVVNNRRFGTIHTHQERRYPGRVMATTLVNPDFAALARSHGAHAEVVKRTVEVAPALERALESGRTAVIEWRLD